MGSVVGNQAVYVRAKADTSTEYGGILPGPLGISWEELFRASGFLLLARHTRMTEGKNKTRLASTPNEGIGPMDGSGISVANFLCWFGRF